MVLSYGDGSLAVISYGRNGHDSTGKERLEVLGRGHSAVIDDYHSLELDGRVVKDLSPGKGHAQELVAFLQSVRSGDGTSLDTRSSFASMAATLRAVESRGIDRAWAAGRTDTAMVDGAPTSGTSSN